MARAAGSDIKWQGNNAVNFSTSFLLLSGAELKNGECRCQVVLHYLAVISLYLAVAFHLCMCINARKGRNILVSC